jgi:transcriptional regulator with XRE-family HTH domain
MNSTSSNAFQKLKDRARRRRFIANQIKNGFAFQVRALRKDRAMTQQELAGAAKTTQTVISRIEKNGASNLNVKTLLKIADAFDVALVVRLVPIDQLISWVDGLSPSVMAPARSQQILTEMETASLRERVSAIRNSFRVTRNTGSRMSVHRQAVPSSQATPQPQLPFMYPRPQEVVRTETETHKETVSPELIPVAA